MIDPGSLPGQTASLDFGEQTQFQRERRAIESAGRAQPGTQPGPAGPAGAAPQAPPGGGQPVQPGPQEPQQRQPLRPDDLRPGGPVFMQPKLAPTAPWRTELAAWASHPNAGPALAALSRRANAGVRDQQQAGQ